MSFSKKWTQMKGAKRYFLAGLGFFSIFVFLTWAGCVQQSRQASLQISIQQTNVILQVPIQVSAPPQLPPQSNAPSSLQQFAGQQPIPILDLEKQMVDFEKTLTENARAESASLSDQADKHRSLLEFYYRVTLGFLALCASVLAFIFAKNIVEAKDIINTAVESEIKRLVRSSVNTSIAQFKDELEKIKLDGANAVKKIEYTHDRRVIIWISSIIARAYIVLDHEPIRNPDSTDPVNLERREDKRLDEERLDVISDLNEIQTKWKEETNRTIAIVLGRLYKLAHQFAKASAELEKVLNKMNSADQDYIRDSADLLFNQACYLNLQADENEIMQDEIKREELKDAAWKLLKRSVESRKANKELAKTDLDLKSLFDEKKRPREDL
jgi:hypothetical protein